MITVDDVMVAAPPVQQAGGNVPDFVDPMAWFSSPGPFEIEIGCGKGGFLLERARANPDLRLLGIEWANKYFRHAADRMARWQLTNVRVMRADAGHFVVHHLPPGCLSALHVYHPDPWPKKRHHKRRLIQPGFIRAAVRALMPRGRWLVQSDHEEYFGVIVALLDQQPELTSLSWDEAWTGMGRDWAGTNFEVKYTREGRAIFRAAYRRNES